MSSQEPRVENNSKNGDTIDNTVSNKKDAHSNASTERQPQNNAPLERPPLSQLTDRFGNTFYFGNAGDYWHPPFTIGANTDYRTHLYNIRNLEIRPDDILICSYPKTGLHWTLEIVTMLRNKKVEHLDDSQARVGFVDQRPTSLIDTVPSPRILFIHVPFRHLPKQIFDKKIKIILLDRNPKDVLVSYYNHWHMRKAPIGYSGTFEQFFQLYFEVGYLYGHFFDYMMEWQKGIEANPHLDVFLSVFEDMKIDPVGGVKKLNNYLGTGCSDELCTEIAIACSFQNMKEFKDQHTPASLKTTMINSSDSIYRKGDVGDWKNWFTDEMNEKFDNEFNKWMKDYKTKYIFTLP